MSFYMTIKPDLIYFHVFGALCYPTNDNEDLGKLKPKVDIEIFICYSPVKKAYQIYNRQTRLIVETIHVEFEELTAMASEQFGSGLEIQLMTPGTISSGLVQNQSSSTPYVPPTKKDWDILFQPMFDEYFQMSPSVVSRMLHAVDLIPTNKTGTPSLTSIDQDAPFTSTSPTSHETQSLVIHPVLKNKKLKMHSLIKIPSKIFSLQNQVLKNHHQTCFHPTHSTNG
ncbi:hypothetical protein Tco_1502142 [Tanacetum coccineum]